MNDPSKNTGQVTLVGHSMGAAISCFYAACFPEQVNQLVLLDGAGPLDRNPRDIAKHVRSHVTRRFTDNNHLQRKPRIYPTLELAVETRCKTAENFPGNQWLSTAASTEMVLRGTEPVGSGGEENYDSQQQLQQQQTGFRFRHDPRLQWPSCQFVSWEQVMALYQDLNCPTALLMAEHGWPKDEAKLQKTLELIQPDMYDILPGSHHFHADPETAGLVAEKVLEFLDLN